MKKLNLKLLIGAIILMAFASEAFAQQEIQHTQYLYNKSVFNPAYAGSRDVLSTSLIYRNQWVKMEGAPVTASVSAHSPLRKANMALGFSYVYDKLGLTKTNSFNVQYAYHIPVEKNKLSLGLQTGIRSYSNQLTQVELIDQNDPAFQEDVSGNWTPSFGLGAYYYSNTYFIGLSMPNILATKLDYRDEGISKRQNHIYAMAGYVFELSPSVKFRPSILVKQTTNAPLQADVNLSFYLMNTLWLGFGLRTSDSFNFMLMYQINPALRLGYSYDLSTSQYKKAISGSHEFMIGYELNFESDNIVSPRLF